MYKVYIFLYQTSISTATGQDDIMRNSRTVLFYSGQGDIAATMWFVRYYSRDYQVISHTLYTNCWKKKDSDKLTGISDIPQNLIGPRCIAGGNK